MNFALIALQVRCSKNSCLSLASKCQSYFRRHHRRECAFAPLVLESGTPGTLRCPGFDIACIDRVCGNDSSDRLTDPLLHVGPLRALNDASLHRHDVLRRCLRNTIGVINQE